MSNTTSETLKNALERLIIENQSEDGSIDISDQRAMRDEILELFESEIQERVKEAKRQTMIRELGWANRNGIEGVRRRIAELTKEEGKV